MLHKYQSLQESSDRMLWDRIENDKKRLLKWAKEKKPAVLMEKKLMPCMFYIIIIWVGGLVFLEI